VGAIATYFKGVSSFELAPVEPQLILMLVFNDQVLMIVTKSYMTRLLNFGTAVIRPDKKRIGMEH